VPSLVTSAPHPTIAQLLDERADALVGRDRELAALLRLVEPGGGQVAYVHGVAGAGKSALLRAFAARARALGVATVQLDAADVEPTARGLHGALAAALPDGSGTGGDAAGRLAALGERVVLALDAMERLRLLEDWLRRAWIPALPQHVRVVLAGRERPDPSWAATYAELLIDLPLGNLPAAAVATLLARLGVAGSDVSRVNRVARGHPLSLQLAASALAARPDLPLDQVATTAVVDHQAGLYLDGLERPARQALDAAALVRRPTRSLLRSMLPDVDADDAFARLEALPFTQLGSDGLTLHDAVREALDAALRARDPERRRRLRTAAYRHHRSELRAAQPGELWRATADMLHLIDNPLIRDGFFPPAEQRYAVEPAGEGDRPAIADIAGRHEPRATADLLAAWSQAAPETFRVARDRRGDVAGVIALCEPGAVPLTVLDGDPVAMTWREDLRRRPVRREERVVFVRWLLSRDHGESPGPVQAALWVDAKRTYMELRPHLRRMYTQFRHPEVFAPMLEPLGFVPLDHADSAVGDATYRSFVLDFGPRSIDGWLAMLVAGELELDDEPLLDTTARGLRLGEHRIPLTELELSLVSYLYEREGQAVARSHLLRDVWGDQWQGGSNVVDVAVSALRRKLGDHATMIETVRGVGYRMRPPPDERHI
jgi:hypothetical protein